MRSALDLLRELRAGNAPGASAPQPSELSPCLTPAPVTGGTTPGIAVLPADEVPRNWLGLRVASRVLGEDVCPAPDDARSEPMGPWRIVVEHCDPRPGPIKFNTATTITNPALCIENRLVELERAVLHKNAGRKTAFTELIDEYLQFLTICGCQVRVERIS